MRADWMRCGFWFAAWLLIGAAPAQGEIYFVDNRQGNDAFDGMSKAPVDNDSGPIRTLARASRMLRQGDTLEIVNTGVPYAESLSLTGARLGIGRPLHVTINGNGAELKGSRPIPREEFSIVGPDLWKFTPYRKGFYAIYLDGRPLPEHRVAPHPFRVPPIPVGHWGAWQGSIYFQAQPAHAPYDGYVEYAVDDAGLILSNVRGVTIRDLTIRHFRLDGVHVADLCRDVVFENIVAFENGRSGLAVGGSSHVQFFQGELRGNRQADVLVTELGKAEVVETMIGDEE